MTNNGRPRVLDGCDVLPPLEPAAEPTEPPPHGVRRKGQEAKGKAAGRFTLLNAFVDATAGRLTRGEILVWLVLYRDSRDGIARTSQADIARRAALAERSVRRVLGRLARRGLLRIVYRGGLNRGTSRYRVLAVAREGD